MALLFVFKIQDIHSKTFYFITLFSDTPYIYIVWGVSIYQDVCLWFCVSTSLLVRNKKNKSGMDDFNAHKSGIGYPRRWGLLLNEYPG